MKTLETKNVMTREGLLKAELATELEREQKLQERYQIVKAQLESVE